MARRLSDETKKKRKMGTGEGKDYIPYITTSEINSLGTTSVIRDWKTGRGVHCLSQGEALWYYILRWDDNNVDIREQAYIPFNFFRGQRCKYCNERVTRNILENMLSACSEGRYTITDYSKVSCVVLDKRTGNEISIFPRKLRQEIVRPTPSDLFEFSKKITEVDVAMSEWDFFFRLLCEYREEYGNTNVPGRVVYKSHRLGSWVGSQRNAYQNNKLRKDREDLLRSIGFDFEWRETVWLQKFEIYRHYVEITGNPCVSFQTDFEGIHLGIWISEQKKAYRAGTLSEDRRKKLEELGMTF